WTITHLTNGERTRPACFRGRLARRNLRESSPFAWHASRVRSPNGFMGWLVVDGRNLIRHPDLSGLFHKYAYVRCAQFGPWRGAREGVYPQRYSTDRATSHGPNWAQPAGRHVF